MKRLIALLCAVVMVCVMFGCAKDETATTDPADTSSTTEDQTAEPTTDDTQDTSGETEEEHFKVAYAALCEDNDFGVATTESFQKEAEKMGWELVILNNDYDGAKAIENMDTVLTQECDGFVNFQVDAGVAPTIAEMAKEANLPMITVDCPHPDTPNFGANNVEAGLILGGALAKKAQEEWDGQVDMIVLCGAPGSGEVVDQRMQNIAVGIKDTLGNEDIEVVELDGKSEIETSQKIIADILTANPDKEHILIGCLNDQSGLGAFNAVEAANRQDDVFIGSHGCDVPAINNLKNNDANCWIGSVAYFPERYGEYLVPLMDKLLHGEEIPMENFPGHVFVDKSNIDEYY